VNLRCLKVWIDRCLDRDDVIVTAEAVKESSEIGK
jgi:hypothetical protein